VERNLDSTGIPLSRVVRGVLRVGRRRMSDQH
jgi:hypothetical protein